MRPRICLTALVATCLLGCSMQDDELPPMGEAAEDPTPTPIPRVILDEVSSDAVGGAQIGEGETPADTPVEVPHVAAAGAGGTAAFDPGDSEFVIPDFESLTSAELVGQSSLPFESNLGYVPS